MGNQSKRKTILRLWAIFEFKLYTKGKVMRLCSECGWKK